MALTIKSTALDDQIGAQGEHADPQTGGPLDRLEQGERVASATRVFSMWLIAVAGGTPGSAAALVSIRSTIDDDEAAGGEGDGEVDEDAHHVDGGEERGGHEGAREDQQHADDDGGDGVEPLGLTHGPSTSRSLHSSRRKTAADGRRSPARAWTLVVIRPRGALGISTMAGGHDDHGGVAQVELLGVLEAAVERVADAEDVAEGVAGRQGHRGRTENAGVEQDDGEHGAQDVAVARKEVGDAGGVGELPERPVP